MISTVYTAFRRPVRLKIAMLTMMAGLFPCISPGADAPELRQEPITPIPLQVELDPTRVALGERLFNDRQLSDDGNSACGDCHILDQGGDNGRTVDIDPAGGNNPLNTPTVFNVAYNASYGWLGQHSTLEAQANADLTTRSHNNLPWPAILGHLRSTAGYPQQFNAIYPDGITRANVLDALTSFERSLITPNAPFDRWLRGDPDAISDDALEGYQQFKNLGCISCHQGVNIGGNLFQRIGIFGDFFAGKDELSEADQGRRRITGRQRDLQVFRVPSLRNVAVTPPYFHDGRTDSLSEAIKLVGRFQLNRQLSPEDIDKLESFLHSLTGEFRGRPLNHD